MFFFVLYLIVVLFFLSGLLYQVNNTKTTTTKKGEPETNTKKKGGFHIIVALKTDPSCRQKERKKKRRPRLLSCMLLKNTHTANPFSMSSLGVICKAIVQVPCFFFLDAALLGTVFFFFPVLFSVFLNPSHSQFPHTYTVAHTHT